MTRRAALVLVTLATTASAQDIDVERRALARAQTIGRVAQSRALRLEASARDANDEAARIRADAVAIAARVQAAEADIATAQARVAVVSRLRAEQRARLAAQQGPTARLLAALQTLARRPAALALVQPGSIADLVHVNAVFASIKPVIDARTRDLRADVARGRQLAIAANAALAAERSAQASLVTQRQRLAALEARKRAESRRYASGAMVEQDRAIAMTEEARDITDLMGRFDDIASVRARLESLPGPILRPARPGEARVEQAAVVTRSIPAYRLPVVGEVVTGLGEISATGVRARGLTIATRNGAQVVAPTSGRIAFAGPFRGYGRIVVIDHGSGWTTLITSLATLAVAIGDTVDQGSPLGRAGDDRPTITVELRRRGEPVDIARLAG